MLSVCLKAQPSHRMWMLQNLYQAVASLWISAWPQVEISQPLGSSTCTARNGEALMSATRPASTTSSASSATTQIISPDSDMEIVDVKTDPDPILIISDSSEDDPGR